jgi:hypothetical protein
MGRKRFELKGKRFGKLTVLSFHHIGSPVKHSHWLVRCDCGKELVCAGHNLVRGGSSSCGCGHKGCYSKKGTALRGVFRSYTNQAKNRGLSFSLSINEFKNLTSSSCYYCGALPSNERKARGNESYFYNGLDRKDNNIGYEIENCLPCCFFCNSAKRNISYEDFLKWIQTVYSTLIGDNHGKKN